MTSEYFVEHEQTRGLLQEQFILKRMLLHGFEVSVCYMQGMEVSQALEDMDEDVSSVALDGCLCGLAKDSSASVRAYL